MNERLLRAINVASWAHTGQLRKGTDLPYVSHVYGVMFLVSQQPGAEENTLIAALLHDVLEDASERYLDEAMENDFGLEVLELVRSVTKDRTLPTWKDRADEYLEQLKQATPPVLMIVACDKVHNLSSILADYETAGERLWERFNSGKQSQLWWYRSVYDVAISRLDELNKMHGGTLSLPILEDYRMLLTRLECIVDGH